MPDRDIKSLVIPAILPLAAPDPALLKIARILAKQHALSDHHRELIRINQPQRLK